MYHGHSSQNFLTFPWLSHIQRFSLTFYRILWLFPDLEKYFLPDFSLTAGNLDFRDYFFEYGLYLGSHVINIMQALQMQQKVNNTCGRKMTSQSIISFKKVLARAELYIPGRVGYQSPPKEKSHLFVRNFHRSVDHGDHLCLVLC